MNGCLQLYRSSCKAMDNQLFWLIDIVYKRKIKCNRFYDNAGWILNIWSLRNATFFYTLLLIFRTSTLYQVFQSCQIVRISKKKINLKMLFNSFYIIHKLVWLTVNLIWVCWLLKQLESLIFDFLKRFTDVATDEIM